MNKLVYGVGFNDKTRPTFVDGKIVKEYTLWQDMLYALGHLLHLSIGILAIRQE